MGIGTNRLARRALPALFVLAIAAQAQAAVAAGPIESFSLQPTTTQAGGHPDVSASIALEEVDPPEEAEGLVLEWPEGLSFLAPAVSTCELADLTTGQCPSDSQLGLATIREADEGAEVVLGTVPVFAVETAPGVFARIGFVVPGVGDPVLGEFSLWSGSDYGTRLTLGEFPQSTPLAGLDLALWGVPAEVTHDPARFPTGSEGCPGAADTSCIATPTSSNLPPVPQIESPTACVGPYLATALLTTHAETTYYAESTYPGTTGCPQLSFDPSATMAVTTAEARSPTGLDLDLRVPQTQSAATPSPSELRDAEVVFEDGVLLGFGPESMQICTFAEAGIGSEEPPSCPDGARLGTATIESALLPGPISGSVYYSGEDAEGSYFAVLTASGNGVDVKLPLILEEDLSTGAATIAFPILPQIPISEIAVHLLSSTELLETVNACGEFEAHTEFRPWDDELSNRSATSHFSLTSGPLGTPCPGPASRVDVTLSPPRIPVASSSTTTATALVTDANGGPAIGDLVVFRSSDPGEHVGPVTETADGAYTATISSPSTPGAIAITAVDRSVEPNVSGTATLDQVALATPPGPRRLIPATRITRHPSRRTRNRRPSFAFTSNVAGARFRCSVDRKPFHRCASPLRLRRLAPGGHRFRVFAMRGGDRVGKTAVFRFTVLRRARA